MTGSHVAKEREPLEAPSESQNTDLDETRFGEAPSDLAELGQIGSGPTKPRDRPGRFERLSQRKRIGRAHIRDLSACTLSDCRTTPAPDFRACLVCSTRCRVDSQMPNIFVHRDLQTRSNNPCFPKEDEQEHVHVPCALCGELLDHGSFQSIV